MDKTERGQLLLEREEVEKRHSELRTRLAEIGTYLTNFGTALSRAPNDIVFVDPPEEIIVPRRQGTSIPLFRVNWKQFPDIHDIAHLISAMGTARQRLTELQQILD